MCAGVPDGLFQSVGTYQGGAAVVFVHVAYFFGNFNPGVCLVQFLPAEFFGKDGEEVFRLQWLPGGRVQGGEWLVFHVSLDVVPIPGYLVFRKHESFSFFAHNVSVLVD